jgi:hypothetical protein
MGSGHQRRRGNQPFIDARKSCCKPRRIAVASIGRTTVGLRVFGDDLDPLEVSTLLCAEPTRGWRKGEAKGLTSSGKTILARTGAWLLSVPDRSPGDLEGQLCELFAALTGDLSVWRDLTERYECDVFCGLFMRAGNEGADLEPDTVAQLASRGLAIRLDIYDPTKDA